ncbi:MAG: ATP-binding protein [Leptospirales bacterium]|nr:ATP-binding protein [Leptospirales bacterium]
MRAACFWFATGLSLSALCGLGAQPTTPLSIDLNAETACVRAWSPAAASEFALGAQADQLHSLQENPDWHCAPPSQSGSRRLRASDWPLAAPSSLAERLWPGKAAPQEMTAVLAYSLSAEQLQRGPWRLELQSISSQWIIYLNGRALHSCWPAEGIGPTAAYYARLCPKPVWKHRLSVAIPPDWQQVGRNLLVFRFRGDLRLLSTGLPEPGTHQLQAGGERDAELSLRFSFGLLMLFFFTGLFHVALFAMRRDEKASIYFGLFSIVLALYYFSRSIWREVFYAPLAITERVENGMLALLTPLIGIALELLIERRRISSVSRVGVIYFGLLAILMAVGPPHYAEFLIPLWQITAPLFIVYYIALLVQGAYRSARTPEGLSAQAALASPSLQLILGAAPLAAAGIVDIVAAGYYRDRLELTPYAMLLFLGVVSVILARRFVRAIEKVDLLNRQMNERMEDLNRVNRSLAESESRYRSMIEGASDIILSLDSNLCILDANRNLHRLLGISLQVARGRPLMDLVYLDRDEASGITSKQLLKEKLETCRQNRTPFWLKVRLLSHYTGEPRELHLRVDAAERNGEVELTCKLSSVVEDSLLRYFVSERQKYVLSNSMVSAEELSQRLVRNLEKYLEESHVVGVRFGLREMLVNAIEHGNLAISFDEKTRELTAGNYKKFIRARQQDDRYRQRRVVVHYSLNPLRVIFLIEDQGNGFDWRQRLQRSPDHDTPHGRGIQLTSHAFDRIRYLGNGNRVYLLKRLGRRRSL